MTRIELPGVDGSNPLGFLAALGLLRLLPGIRLGFVEDGSFAAFLDSYNGSADDLVKRITTDALDAKGGPWRLTYTKAATKKQGPKEVADLKAPPTAFRAFLARCVEDWLQGHPEPVAYAAAYGTDVAVDGKGNTKPTAFHFTAANQEFLAQVENSRSAITADWTRASLFEGNASRSGANLRWDPNAERNWALMAANPNDDGTKVNAPLEWLAFRGLPVLPSFPRGTRVVTTAVSRRGQDLTFSWPLWSVPASLYAARSVVQADWAGDRRERLAHGIFAVCSSAIRRTSQGFGNFSPSAVTP